MKYLIAGLGNIGAEYQHTRHNIGFDVVEAFAAKHEARFEVDRLASVTSFRWKARQFVCIMPTTYMNLSGKALKYWMDKEKIVAANVLVILDDLALPINRMRFRPEGSDGGHNGLKSIQETLGTTQYPRLRMGIGNDYAKGKQAEFVLGKWKADEEPVIRQKIVTAVEAIEVFATAGLPTAMNRYNNLQI